MGNKLYELRVRVFGSFNAKFRHRSDVLSGRDAHFPQCQSVDEFAWCPNTNIDQISYCREILRQTSIVYYYTIVYDRHWRILWNVIIHLFDFVKVYLWNRWEPSRGTPSPRSTGSGESIFCCHITFPGWWRKSCLTLAVWPYIPPGSLLKSHCACCRPKCVYW